MNRINEITIHAPLNKVFAAASDLARWPEFLPHYRYNRFVSQTPSGGVVRMSCVRAGISITWVSEYRIDTRKRQLHFNNVESPFNAVRGTKSAWTFEELPEGRIHVTITHDLKSQWPLVGPPMRDLIVWRFFIHHIARKTLAGLKHRLEAQEQRAGTAPGPVAEPEPQPKREKVRKRIFKRPQPAAK